MYENEFGILLYVRNVRQSAEFYRDVLGFTFHGWWSEGQNKYFMNWNSDEAPPFARLSAGIMKLALHAMAAPDGIKEPVDATGCEFHLKVRDVDALCLTLRSRNYEVADPVNESWGWRALAVRDPDGYRWSFYTPT
jgi:uncharacterized glyoxalase superfamily protein PhnB